MRTIMIMYDTLTRKFLPNYGNDWVIAPNFKRLDERCTRFDNFYAGSLPCMPARRELHTGKYNFLHRGWGPVEPFDHSVFELLRKNDIYTHLCTDHSHYWEDGGATYHNRYDSWEGCRGQEGDRWVAHDIMPDIPKDRHELNKTGLSVIQHYRNRTRQKTEEEMSSVKTFNNGLNFIKEHADKDNWFLQIEAFDPHEPFYVPQKYRAMYGLPEEETLNWPRYGTLPEDRDYKEDLKNAEKEYASLITMCDENLGKILDFMDKNDMWKDTNLIINTDHGYLLGEHEWLGKNFPPCFDEIVHLPFFMHVPGVLEEGTNDTLSTTVDIVPTLLDLFNVDKKPMEKMDGKSVLSVLKGEEDAHKHVLFGIHGGYTCISDGKMVYMKASANEDSKPLYEYTLMPTNIRNYFTKDQLMNSIRVDGMSFTNGIPVLKIPSVYNYKTDKLGDRLYDLTNDPEEENNILNPELKKEWNKKLREKLEEVEAPEEEYERLDI